MWLGEEHFTLQSSDVISSTDEKRSRLTRDEEVGDESSVGELLIGDEPDPKSAELSEHPLSAGAAELAQLARSDAVVSHRVDPHVVLQAHVRRCEPDTTRLLRQLTTWHCPRVCFGAPTRNAAAADRRATGRAAIDRYLPAAGPSAANQTWNWVIGSPGQWVIWVIFHVRVTGSPGHHFDPV